MAARTGVQYIVNEVRRISGAGTAEFTVDSTSYFSDDDIERILDSRRARLARHMVVFEPELSDGGGTTVYKRARIGYGWIEDIGAGDFSITDSQGSAIGTGSYTLSPEDGYIVFDSDQAGSLRYITGWVHNPYKAAVDVLVSWSMHLSQQPDFETDNMKVTRSRKNEALRKQIDDLKKIAGMAPKIETVKMSRPDMA